MDKFEKLAQLMADETIAREVLDIDKPEDVQKYLADKGVELSIEEIQEWAKEINKALANEELDADDLDSVAGGLIIRPRWYPIPRGPFPRLPIPRIW